jgi:polyferredoxin
MGIDIRRGLQMECIACGLCVDACDNVMEKIGLPKGLIRYDTESKKRFNPFRPRSFWYGGIITLVGCLMLYTLLTRSPLEMNVIHDRNPLFVKLSDGSIRNGYNITIINKQHEDTSYALSVEGIDGASLRVQASSDMPSDNLSVLANSVGHFRVFITSEKQPQQRRAIRFKLVGIGSNISTSKETIFVSEGR